MPGDGQIRLCHSHLDVSNQIIKERKVSRHAFQQLGISRLTLRKSLERISDAEPCWHNVTALHPSEYPGNSPQIAYSSLSVSARRTRADARVLQFQYRRRLFKVRQ